MGSQSLFGEFRGRSGATGHSGKAGFDSDGYHDARWYEWHDAAKIIQFHIGCPTVLITGCEDSSLVDLATQCLPAGYLYKPVSNSQLYAVVNLALSNKSVRTAHQHQLRLGSDELIKKEIQHGNDPENRQKNFQSLIPSFLIEDILTESVLHSEKNKKFHFQHTCLNEIILPMLQKLHDDGIHLSTAEMKVALLVRLGKSTKQIADILCVSADTIHSHRKHIRKKLGITSSASNLGAHLSNII